MTWANKSRMAIVCGAFAQRVCQLQRCLLSPRLHPLHISPPRLGSAGRPAYHFPLEISPDHVVLDATGQGDTTSAVILLRNTRLRHVTINRVETSCPCVRITPIPVRVGPNETVAVKATLKQTADEPILEARLSIGITGYAADGTILFRSQILDSSDQNGPANVQ